MPFEAKGNKIVRKTDGKVVGHSRSEYEAKKAARVRNAVVYGGFKPDKRKGPSRQSRGSY